MGIVEIDWKVLERNDGAIIQIIYEGSQNVNILVQGVVEGQKKLSTVEYSSEIKSADEQYSNPNNQRFSLIGISIVLIIQLLLFNKPIKSIFKYIREMFQKGNPAGFRVWKKITILILSFIPIGLYFGIIVLIFAMIYSFFNLVYIPFEF